MQPIVASGNLLSVQSYIRLLLWSIVSTFLFSLLFVLYPSLDPAFTGLFWSAEAGFFLKHKFIVEVVSDNIYLLVIAYLIIAVVIAIQSPHKRAAIHSFGYAMTVLIVGPGIIVNGLLKSYWGRARPQDTELFGGFADFTPAWIISDQCDTNCSFVSGHASAAFALYGLCFLLFRQPRTLLLSTAIVTAAGLLVGLGRVVEGRHFLSDTIIAGHLVWLSALLCYYPFFVRGQRTNV